MTLAYEKRLTLSPVLLKIGLDLALTPHRFVTTPLNFLRLRLLL
jgi:hypothetical protein